MFLNWRAARKVITDDWNRPSAFKKVSGTNLFEITGEGIRAEIEIAVSRYFMPIRAVAALFKKQPPTPLMGK